MTNSRIKGPAILKTAMILPILRKFVLLGFLALAVLGLSEVDFIKRYSFLTYNIVWYLWWPMLILLVFFSIRVWCMVCPLRTVADIFSKVGLGLRIPTKLEEHRLVFITLLFLLVHYLTITLGINQFAITTSLYLLILLQYTGVLALIFEKKGFCKVFCPLGVIMEVFSKLGIVRTELPCISCPAGERCTRDCANHNFTYTVRNPLKEIPRVKGLGENLAVVVLLGVMLSEFSERLKGMAVSGGNWNLLMERALNYIPKQLDLMGNTPGQKLFMVFWVYLLLPLALILAIVLVLRIIFFWRNFREHWTNLTSCIVPFIYSGFLAVLINYPLTLLNMPSAIKKLLLLLIMVLGMGTAVYYFFRSLIFARRENDSVHY